MALVAPVALWRIRMAAFVLPTHLRLPTTLKDSSHLLHLAQKRLSGSFIYQSLDLLPL